VHVTRQRLYLWIGIAAVTLVALLSVATPAVVRRLSPATAPAPAATPAAVAPAAPVRFVQAVGMTPATFNPLFATDAAAQAVIDKLYPRLLGQDAQSGFIVADGLATRWEISPDGRVYTFFLRDDAVWSDGQPVTAQDVKFTYDALASAAVQSPYRDRTVGLLSVDAPNATTLVVTLAAPNCAALHSLRQPILPGHRFAPDFSDLATHPLNQTPEVSAGPFRFVEAIAGERVRLAGNPDYWLGAPTIDEWDVRILPDPAARRAALADGSVDLAQFTPEETTGLALPIAATVTTYLAPSDGYSLVAVNLADPATPLAGRGPDDTLLPQPPHPILGDLRVRQALAAAIDYERLLAEVYQGRGQRPTSYVPAAATWAAATDIPLPAYDPARARALLEEAGWRDEDGDGVRSRDGAPLRLGLQTNDDNPQRVQMARLLAEQWAVVGVQIVAVTLPFEELTTALLGQRFDLVVIGWESLGADPGNSPFWHSQADIPGAGFNFTSVQDAEVDGWLAAAAQLPGCDLNRRGAIYRQVQHRVAALQPYLLLVAPQSVWAYQQRWQGIVPGPWRLDTNLTGWRLP
jgi:peptide/nickel transport system substrate-binding protein